MFQHPNETVTVSQQWWIYLFPQHWQIPFSPYGVQPSNMCPGTFHFLAIRSYTILCNGWFLWIIFLWLSCSGARQWGPSHCYSLCTQFSIQPYISLSHRGKAVTWFLISRLLDFDTILVVSTFISKEIKLFKHRLFKQYHKQKCCWSRVHFPKANMVTSFIIANRIQWN